MVWVQAGITSWFSAGGGALSTASGYCRDRFQTRYCVLVSEAPYSAISRRGAYPGNSPGAVNTGCAYSTFASPTAFFGVSGSTPPNAMMNAPSDRVVTW